MKTYKIKDNTDFDNPIIKEWTIDEIVEEINRDRSDDWVKFTKKDWLVGWIEWVEGEFLELLYPYMLSISDGHDEDQTFYLTKKEVYKEFKLCKKNKEDAHLMGLTDNNEYEIIDSTY